MQSLLGIAGYYRKYLPHYADLTLPLIDLLKKKDTQFVWTDVCERSFVNLQATKLFIVTSATKGGWLPPPLDFVLGSRYGTV